MTHQFTRFLFVNLDRSSSSPDQGNELLGGGHQRRNIAMILLYFRWNMALVMMFYWTEWTWMYTTNRFIHDFMLCSSMNLKIIVKSWRSSPSQVLPILYEYRRINTDSRQCSLENDKNIFEYGIRRITAVGGGAEYRTYPGIRVCKLKVVILDQEISWLGREGDHPLGNSKECRNYVSSSILPFYIHVY